MYSKIKYLFKDGFFHILTGSVLVKLIAFISSILIARIVDKANYGRLAYADNLYSYINLFAGLGLSTAIIKFCQPSNEPGKNKFYLSLSLWCGVIFQLALSVLLCIVVSFANIPFPQSRPLVYCLILFPALTQFLNTCQGFVRAMQNNQLYAKIGVIQTAVLLLVSVPTALLVDVYGVPFARYVAMLTVIVMGWRFVRKVIPPGTQIIKPESREISFFWKLSLSMMFASLFSMIMPLNEAFMVSESIRDELVTANYKVATLIPTQLRFITDAIVIYTFPQIAHASQSDDNLSGYLFRTGLIIFALVSSIGLIGYFLSPAIIRTVYGARFEDAIQLSKVYWVVHGLNAGLRVFPGNMLPAMGSTVFNMVVSFLSSLVHFYLLQRFLPIYGIYGAAYALLIIYFLSGAASWIYLFIYTRRIDRRQ